MYPCGNLYRSCMKFLSFTVFFCVTQEMNSEFTEMAAIGTTDRTVSYV